MEEKKFYNCNSDIAFKEMFMNEDNRDILKALLESVLNLEIMEIKYLNLEKNSGNVNVKRKHFDLHLNTNQGNIQIEVNAIMNDYVRPRNMAYICNTYSTITNRGEIYNEKLKVIQINFTYGLSKTTKFKDNKPSRIYRVTDGEKNFIENFLIYELNMDYFLNLWYAKDKEGIKSNKYLIMMGLNKKDLESLAKMDKVVSKYMEELERINDDPDFIEYVSAEKDNRMIENSLREQWKEEGLAEGREEGRKVGLIEGRKEGRKEGREEGRKEGRKEGRAEGVNQSKIEIAKRMKENSIDIEIISKCTGLTVEEIEKL